MDDKDRREVIKTISDLGVSFCIYENGYFLNVNNEELLEIIDNGEIESFIADACGVSVADYKGWLAEGKRIRCSAITKKGTRCTNHAANNKGTVDPEEWARSKGEYCGLHNGGF